MLSATAMLLEGLILQEKVSGCRQFGTVKHTGLGQ